MRCSGSGFGFAITPIQYKYKIARNQAIRRRQKLVIKPRTVRDEITKRGIIDVLRKGIKAYPASLITFYTVSYTHLTLPTILLV